MQWAGQPSAKSNRQSGAKADDILARATALRQSGGSGRSPNNAREGVQAPPNEGSRRLLEAAAQGSRVDKRLWTGIAALTGAQGNSTGLVGTPDQVADAMLDYVDLGISTFLIRGFDPLVDDLAMLLSVMAGYDARTPLSLSEPGSAFTAPLQRDMKGVRIGWLGDLGGIPMEAGMLDLCLNGIRRLEDAGCTIEPASLSMSHEAMWSPFVTLRQGFLAGGLASLYNDPAKRGLFKSEAQWDIEGGMKLSAVDLYTASVRRSAVFQAFRTLFDRFDFLALPSAQVFPFSADLHWPEEVAGTKMDSYHRWMEIVAPASLAGLPTVCVPAGFGPGGLPSGIQVIGSNRADLAVLQVAAAYEQASGQELARMPPVLI